MTDEESRLWAGVADALEGRRTEEEHEAFVARWVEWARMAGAYYEGLEAHDRRLKSARDRGWQLYQQVRRRLADRDPGYGVAASAAVGWRVDRGAREFRGIW